MADHPPVVYLLHGEDELAIAQFIAALSAKLGDPVMAEMNTSRLDGRSISLEQLETATSTLPFMTKRRLVILTNPTARLSSPALREKFLGQLAKIPPAVALVLVENHLLTDERSRKKGSIHWLEKWALDEKERCLLRSFPLPEGRAMAARIQELAKAAGGQFTTPAAVALADLVGDNPRQADQEVQKLLAYVNYNRPVEPEDVIHLTAEQMHGDIFTLVDALGNRQGKNAQQMLHRLLEDQDAMAIFAMVIRQFRMLLLAREVLDSGGQSREVMQALKAPPFVADKVASQARRFDLPTLTAIYHRLLDLDEAAKTSEIELELGLDTFVAGIAQ